MNKGTYIMIKVCIGLMAWAMASTGLAESAWQGETLTYSPDRWPSRWSAIVRQNQPVDERAYGYGSRAAKPVQQGNPWAHDSSVLFEVPAGGGHRPWGEPPRKSRRQQERSTYRDQRRAGYRANPHPLNNQYAYPGIAPLAYPGMAYPFGSPTGLGLAPYGYGYGVSPLMGSPLLTPPLLGAYPYGAYPGGLGGMNWPFGAW